MGLEGLDEPLRNVYAVTGLLANQRALVYSTVDSIILSMTISIGYYYTSCNNNFHKIDLIFRLLLEGQRSRGKRLYRSPSRL